MRPSRAAGRRRSRPRPARPARRRGSPPRPRPPAPAPAPGHSGPAAAAPAEDRLKVGAGFSFRSAGVAILGGMRPPSRGARREHVRRPGGPERSAGPPRPRGDGTAHRAVDRCPPAPPAWAGRDRGALVLAVLVVAGVAVALLTRRPGGEPAARSAERPRAPARPRRAIRRARPEPGDGGGRRAGGLGADTLLVGTVVSATPGGTLVVAPDGGGAERAGAHRRRAPGCSATGAGAPADLPPGDRVVVRVAGSRGRGRTAVTVSSPQARVTGTVTALSAATWSPSCRPTGWSVTVNVTAVGEPEAGGR